MYNIKKYINIITTPPSLSFNEYFFSMISEAAFMIWLHLKCNSFNGRIAVQSHKFSFQA